MLARSSHLLLLLLLLRWLLLMLLLLLLACGEAWPRGHRRGSRRELGCRQRPSAIAAGSGAMG